MITPHPTIRIPRGQTGEDRRDPAALAQELGLEQGEEADHLQVSKEVEELQKLQVAKDFEVLLEPFLLGAFRLQLGFLGG